MHNIINLSPPPPLARLVEQYPLALFLDFDGTLVEIADTPCSIEVPINLDARLHALRDLLGGRLAIVSGRTIADIEKFVTVSDLIVVGSHGAEMGDLSRPSEVLSTDGEAAIAEMVRRWPGLLIEHKPHGVAVHYRQEPDAAPTVYTVMDELARTQGLAARRGKMVVELGPRSTDKGIAVAGLMKSSVFAGATPWFIGDDVTDEDGFAAVAGHGGHGILVGPHRSTAAHFRLDRPAEVYKWLTH